MSAEDAAGGLDEGRPCLDEGCPCCIAHAELGREHERIMGHAYRLASRIVAAREARGRGRGAIHGWASQVAQITERFRDE